MNTKERSFISLVLLGVCAIILADIITDAGDGATWWHIFGESLIAIAAVVGLFLLLRDGYRLKASLAKERHQSTQLHAEAEKWRTQSKKTLEGLSLAIQKQLAAWQLTASEQEIAFLLLKGFSLKEIAAIRGTSEKTTRAQSMAIYAKSGLSGRSALSGFFLEDLFIYTPTSSLDSKNADSHAPAA